MTLIVRNNWTCGLNSLDKENVVGSMYYTMQLNAFKNLLRVKHEPKPNVKQ